MNNPLDKYLDLQLERLQQTHNYRNIINSRSNGVMIEQNNVQYISFCSNDYLGIIADAPEHYTKHSDYGAGSSRLIAGNYPLYDQLEAAIAKAKNKQSALVFGSGYLANIGAISALASQNDLILLDKLSHACMLDGAKISDAKIIRFAHNNMAHLRKLLAKHRANYRNCLIASETIFSMDGDYAPMAELRVIADEYDAWLLVDDAHGYGLPHVQTAKADIVIGTFSKAIGSYGGYVAGSASLRNYLINHARSLIFTTALPEAISARTLQNINQIAHEGWRAEKILEYEGKITKALGLPTQQSPIIPIILGDNEATISAQTKLKQQGILVSAIRPPTVPQGSSRLRISLCASHTKQHIDALINSLTQIIT